MANTMSKYGSNTNRPLSEIVGLSTDTKPTDSIEGVQIQNGSIFRELDTGKKFLFDAENTTWNEVSSGGGGSTLIEKSISANGVYNASDDNADGYSKVTVDVSGGGGTFELAVTVTVEPTGEYAAPATLSCDKTHSEIVSAFNNGDKLIPTVTINTITDGQTHTTTLEVALCTVYEGMIWFCGVGRETGFTAITWMEDATAGLLVSGTAQNIIINE